MDKKAAFTKDEIQQKLIGQIFQHIGKSPEKKRELAKRLGLSVHALYKRLEGKTYFKMQEVASLVNMFQLSFDDLIIDDPFYAKVYLTSQKSPVLSIEDYLLNLQNLMQSLQPLTETEVTYVAAEVPIFYYFMAPHLGCFKLFTFAKHVWNISSLREEDLFRMTLFSPALIEKMKMLWEDYREIHSLEIWTPHIWLTTLTQLEYYIDNDLFFSKKDAKNILLEIQEVILQMRRFILEGSKSNEPDHTTNLHVLDNRLLYSNNMIRVQKNDKRLLLVTHDNPNYLHVEEGDLLYYTNAWFDKLLLASESLKRKKQLDDFFSLTNWRIDGLKSKLKMK